MTIKERLDKIRGIFSAAPPTPAPAPAPAPKKLDEAKVVSYPVDGSGPVFTDISDDSVPGLDQNDYVFTDEDLTTAYPDGTYNVTGTTFSFTVTGGIITAIVDANGTGPGEAIPNIEPALVPPAPTPATPPVDLSKATPAQMREMYAKFGSGLLEDRLTLIETMLKALVEYNFGYEIRQANQQDAIAAYKDILANNTLQMSKHEEFSKQTLELIEQLAKEPSTDPKTLPEPKKETFNSKKEERLKGFAEAVGKLKEEKQVR